MIKRHKRAGLIARASSFVLAMAMFTQAAQGQDAPAAAPSADTAPSEGEAAAITVVGSQIKEPSSTPLCRSPWSTSSLSPRAAR